jgi:hypothetical protein
MDLAVSIYNSQRSSLGLLAVYKMDDHFEYDPWTAVVPSKEQLRSFIEDVFQQDDLWRIVIHGRLATHGEVIEEHAHPLEIECDECDIDYLLHNGVVREHRDFRLAHEDDNHTYSTEVDSEAIAHQFGTVPESIEDTHEDTAILAPQPAYILANRDRFYVHNGYGYELTGQCEMHLNRSYSTGIYSDANHTELIVTANADD